MAGIIGANNKFGNDFGHPSAGLQGTILAVYEVRLVCHFRPLRISLIVSLLGRRLRRLADYHLLRRSPGTAENDLGRHHRSGHWDYHPGHRPHSPPDHCRTGHHRSRGGCAHIDDPDVSE
jgi:hypothetical protein